MNSPDLSGVKALGRTPWLPGGSNLQTAARPGFPWAGFFIFAPCTKAAAYQYRHSPRKGIIWAPGGACRLIPAGWWFDSTRPAPPIWTTAMRHGTITWFNSVKGRGFIRPDDGGQPVEFYVEASQCNSPQASTLEGSRVSFTVATPGDGRLIDLNALRG